MFGLDFKATTTSIEDKSLDVRLNGISTLTAIYQILIQTCEILKI